MRLNYIIMLFYCGSLVSGYELVTLLESTFPPLTIAASRALIAALTSFGFCWLARQPIIPALRSWIPLSLIGVLGFGTLWAVVSLGQQSVDPELSMLLVCVVPVATLIITALPPNPRRMPWLAWIGTAIATLGLIIMISPKNLFDEPSKGYAVLMIIFGFASFALANALAESITRKLAPLAVGGVTMLSAAIVLWLGVLFFESFAGLSPNTEAWLQLAGLGVIGSAVPAFLLFTLVKRAGAGFTSLYGYVMPLFGLMVGWLAFGRPPQPAWLLGIPITFFGVAIVQRNWKGRQ